MKRVGLLALAVVLFWCPVVVGAGSDVVGWRKAKWGMTHSQLAKMYSMGAWEKDDPPRCFLKEPANIQDEQFHVAFWFDQNLPSGKLVKVTLAAASVSSKFSSIYGHLVKKYGEANKKHKNFINDLLWIWVKSSGQIVLVISEPKSTMVLCRITYTAVAEKENI